MIYFINSIINHTFLLFICSQKMFLTFFSICLVAYIFTFLFIYVQKCLRSKFLSIKNAVFTVVLSIKKFVENFCLSETQLFYHKNYILDLYVLLLLNVCYFNGIFNMLPKLKQTFKKCNIYSLFFL